MKSWFKKFSLIILALTVICVGALQLSETVKIEASNNYLSINVSQPTSQGPSGQIEDIIPEEELDFSAITVKTGNQYEIDYAGTTQKIEIGNASKSSTDFKADLTVSKWDIQFKLIAPEPLDEKSSSFDFTDKVISGQVGEWDIQYKTTDLVPEFNDSGGLDIILTAKAKPKSNTIAFTFDSANVTPYLQPELSAQEITEGAFRPEHVINSIAFYASEKSNYILSQTNYKTGKVGHLYRMKCFDDKGEWTWFDWSLGKDSQIIGTIDQKFLDNAVYPVKIQPVGDTFGYTSIGASTDYESQDYLHSQIGTGSVGTAQSVSVYLNNYIASAVPLKTALYQASDNTLVSGSPSSEYSLPVGSGWGWVTLDCLTPPSITAQDYWITYWNNSYEVQVRYDTSTGDQSLYKAADYDGLSGVFPSSISPNNKGTNKKSVYATYTSYNISTSPTSKDFGIVATSSTYWSNGTAPTLGSVEDTNAPTANTDDGTGWTNPTNAYSESDTYASASAVTGGGTYPPTANANGTLAWTNPTNAYASDTSYATASPTYGSTQIKLTTANTNGTYPWTNPNNANTSDTSYATAVQRVPTYRATGAMSHGTTGSIAPALPTGTASGDVVICVASTIAGGSITMGATGSIGTWNALSGSPIDVTGGEKLYVWWGASTGTGTTGPTLTPGGDHCVGRTVGFYYVNTTSPIDVSNTGTEATSDTSFSFATGLTTNYNYEQVVYVCSTGVDPASDSTAQFGTWTGANLASRTERMDNDVNEGGGGGFGLAHGPLNTAGAVGTLGATLATASVKSYIAFALKPQNPSYDFDQIYGTFAQTDPLSGTGSTITKVEIGYEAFATATQKLNLYTSTDGGSNWSSAHLTGNLATSDPGAYTYVDVTSDYTWTWTLLNDTNLKVRVDTQWISGSAITWSLDALNVRVTYDDRRVYEQTYGTYGITGSSSITKVEVGYEAFSTATGQLDIYTSSNGGSGWSSAHNTGNLGTTDPGAITWIDVTADYTWTWTLLNDTNLKVKASSKYGSGTPTFSLDYLPVRVTAGSSVPSTIYGTYGYSLSFTPTKVEIGVAGYTSAGSAKNLAMYSSWDGGSTWSSKHTVSLPTSDSDAIQWIDCTADTTWTTTNTNDSNLKVKITHDAGDSSYEYVDYLPVRITYTATLQDADAYFTATNDGEQCDVDVHGHNFTGNTGWALVITSPGTDEVRLTIYVEGSSTGTIITTSDQELIDAFAASATIDLELKMETPSVATFGDQVTGIITLTAVAED